MIIGEWKETESEIVKYEGHSVNSEIRCVSVIAYLLVESWCCLYKAPTLISNNTKETIILHYLYYVIAQEWKQWRSGTAKPLKKAGKFKLTKKHMYEMLWYGGTRCRNVIFSAKRRL